MGYETKMFLVECHEQMKENGAAYCSPIAEIELCKIGYYGALAKLDACRPSKPLAYIYSIDGNTRVTEDRYGKNLGFYDVEEVLTAMKTDNETENYRRFGVGIAVLEAAIGKFENLKVLFFGH